MARSRPFHSARQSLVLQPRKYHFALALLSMLVVIWTLALPTMRANDTDFAMLVLLGAVSLALLGFGVGFLQRVEVCLNRQQDTLLWEARTLIGTVKRSFPIDEIAEFGMHRQRVRTGYAVRPAILFKDRRRKPFPLLTVSVNGDRAVSLQQTLNAWLEIDQTVLDVEIPEEDA